MAIEVLLMADIADVGQEGDVVRVAEGYARNYLFPKSLAAPVTAATRRKLAKLRVEREATRKLALDAAREVAKKMAGLSVTLPVKTTEGEKLYGAVHAANIADAIKAQGVAIDKSCVQLAEPIKALGVYDVTIRLHPDVESVVKVWIVEE
jgi:large subunit ribosomal protein L9